MPMRYVIYTWLFLIFVITEAMATEPPDENESWICSIEATVEEVSNIKETRYLKPDNFNYAPAQQREVGYIMVSLRVKATAPNPQSRWPLSECPLVQKTWSNPIPLCVWEIPPLGTTIKARFTTWGNIGNLSGVAGYYCLALQAK
jgi:hypothetical protein